MILTYIQSIEDINKQKIVEQIYNIYYPKMLACAKNILTDNNDALDAVQDAFYNITRTCNLFTDPNSEACAALVHIYTKNSALDIYRKTKKRNDLIILGTNLDNIPDCEIDLQNALIKEETYKTVSRAINSLPTQYRDIILLKYYYKMSSKDISLIVHISPKAVDKKTHKAKSMINKMLGGKIIWQNQHLII